MKKSKKIILVSFLVFITLINYSVFASNVLDIKTVEYSEAYKKYLELSDEEKESAIEPRPFEVYDIDIKNENPLYLLKEYGTNYGANEPSFFLRNVIPNNMIVKDQQNTDTCWTFTGLASLETNLAMLKGDSKVYDFSERHVDYATSLFFRNSVRNPYGMRRNVGGNGNWNVFEVYATNGLGAIPESEMPFENNSNVLDISAIQNKTVSSQIYDTIYFPSYKANTITEEAKQKMKEHIKNYGALECSISAEAIYGDCYNRQTAAYYCYDSDKYDTDHVVSIVGWIDNYPTSEFNSAHKPQKEGAWIARNSWGDQVLADGYFFISYEDENVYSNINGIVKSNDSIDYENIYRYDEFGSFISVPFNKPNKMYLANVFDKKTDGKEYITQVAINAPETYKCKVFVNPNGTSKAKNDLQEVSLKAGQYETIDAGYHTLEFSNPVEITGNSFVIVVEIQNERQDRLSILGEGKILMDVSKNNIAFDEVVLENGKCFISSDEYFNQNIWDDLSLIGDVTFSGMDSTVKAFTVSKVEDDSLNSIEITNLPNKTKYIEGENFDKTGMIVIAKYNNGKTQEITDYNITNGNNLQANQTDIVISFDGKEVVQKITVEKNSAVKLEITKLPNKLEYKVGNNFDKTGMKVLVTLKNGEVKEISNYEIVNGVNLKNGQTSVTIKYEELSVDVNITVEPGTISEPEEKNAVSIEISKKPSKLKYIQNKESLDLEDGMIRVVYNDDSKEEIPMSSDKVTITGFDNKNIGKVTIDVIYDSFKATFEVEIIEEEKIKNTDFSYAKSSVKNAKYYVFSNSSNKEYALLDIEVNNIIRNSKDYKYEYHYYLSVNKDEKNITEWIKISENQNDTKKLSFTINTNDINNLKELLNSNSLYLYVKETITSVGNQSVAISNAIQLEASGKIEKYLDNKKVDDTNKNDNDNENNNTQNTDIEDDTIAKIDRIPFTGSGFMFVLILGIAAIGIIMYVKYKKIDN